MRFYVRKRRTTPAVIIVALIDVLIVLGDFSAGHDDVQAAAIHGQARRIVPGAKNRRE